MANITQEFDNDFMANLMKNAEKMDKENPVEPTCDLENPNEGCETCSG